MLLHADPTKAIKKPYQMVTITYFPTSVQRLYQIGSTTGEWQNYGDQSILVNQGQTIYTKGIDQYGNETRTVSSYTANVSDAMKSETYDGNDATYISNVTNQYIKVDSSMIGRKVRIRWYTQYSFYPINKKFLDQNKAVISTLTNTVTTIQDNTYTVPAGTALMVYEAYPNTSYYQYGRIYEIQPSS